MKNAPIFIAPALLWACIVAPLAAQEDEKPAQANIEWFEDISLEELVNTKVAVATGGAGVSQREAPSIVSLVTADEIRNSGARDLMEVLRLVPGIEFGQDIQGVVGMYVRGNWANDGKMLLLIDGIEMNELAYYSLQLGNRVDVGQIDRVEVIRGPGSARYGGVAELAVVNIITRSAKSVQGVAANGLYSATENGYTRRNVAASAGTSTRNWDIVAHGNYGQGNRSDQPYTTVLGKTFSANKTQPMNPLHANVQASYKGLRLLFMQDNYTTGTQTSGGDVLSKPYKTDFLNSHYDLRYEHKFSSSLTMRTGYNVASTSSYRVLGAIDSLDAEVYSTYQDKILRGLGILHADYVPNDKVSLYAGLEHRYDWVSKLDIAGEPNLFWNGKNQIAVSFGSVFAQAIWKTRIATFTFGGRADRHSIYGINGAPRFAATRVFGKSHVKLLASGSYRSPSPINLAYSDSLSAAGVPQLRPERTRVFEIEYGLQLSPKLYVQANAFTGAIDRVIVYAVYSGGDDGYINANRSGSYGLEAEVRYKDKWGYITANYSYYEAFSDNNTPNYRVFPDSSYLLGAAPSKFTLKAHIKIGKSLSLDPSCIFLSGKYAVTGVNADSTALQTKLAPSNLLNLYVNYTALWNGRIAISLGGNNLLASPYALPQPYFSNSPANYFANDAPLMLPRREATLRMAVQLVRK